MSLLWPAAIAWAAVMLTLPCPRLSISNLSATQCYLSH
jgi:hypothetical protein